MSNFNAPQASEVWATNGLSTPGSNFGLASLGSLPAGTSVQLASGATLDLNGAAQQVASLNDYTTGSQGAVTNSASIPVTLTLGANDGSSHTFSGVISDNASGPLSLVMNGSFTQILAGANTYTGPTTISSGTLQIGNGGSGEALASPTVSISSGALLAFSHADTLDYAAQSAAAGR